MRALGAARDQEAARRSQLAVDSHTEERQVALVVGHLQADADRADVLRQGGTSDR